MSEFVKVCGCRPRDGGAAHTGAGVRKPPREETAGRRAMRSVRRYGDFVAGSVLPGCVDCLFGDGDGLAFGQHQGG
jgi:hypothetical protein